MHPAPQSWFPSHCSHPKSKDPHPATPLTMHSLVSLSFWRICYPGTALAPSNFGIDWHGRKLRRSSSRTPGRQVGDRWKKLLDSLELTMLDLFQHVQKPGVSKWFSYSVVESLGLSLWNHLCTSYQLELKLIEIMIWVPRTSVTFSFACPQHLVLCNLKVGDPTLDKVHELIVMTSQLA